MDAVFAARRRRSLADFATTLYKMLHFNRFLSLCVPVFPIAITHAFGYDVAEHREGPA